MRAKESGCMSDPATMTELDGCPLSHLEITTNGVRLHVVEAGPADGPPVLLLHGFPEFWYGWRRQIPALAAAGHRVWAIDQRGYNTSDKPAGVRPYAIDALAEDILGVIVATGHERVSVIGHDWGGVIAWTLAERAPHRLRRVAILNVPHPAVMQRRMRTDPRQLLRSWYVFAFQLPWLPEFGGRAGNWRSVVNAIRGSSRPGAFTDRDFDLYRQAWSQPGAYTAMINWYRAVLRHPPRFDKHAMIETPTLLIWGARDKFIGRAAAPDSIARCRDGRLEFLEDATHWVQHEEPTAVNRLLLDWLA
jgi:epoxide hydrolase 4